MTPGDQAVANSWGTIVNAALPAIEQVAAGIVTIDLTGVATFTLSVANDAPDQARMAFIQFTGAPSGTSCTVTIPAVARIGWVSNQTTKPIILTCGGSGATQTVPITACYLYFCDGTNVDLVVITPAGTLSALGGVVVPNNVPYSAQETGGATRSLLIMGADNYVDLFSGSVGWRVLNQAGTGILMTILPSGAASFAAGLSAVTINTSALINGGGGVTASGFDAGGANFRAIAGSYGVMLRNDGANAYLMQTNAGDPFGVFNTSRIPFQWNFSTGVVTIDQPGFGATFGGTITANIVNANRSTIGGVTIGTAATGFNNVNVPGTLTAVTIGCVGTATAATVNCSGTVTAANVASSGPVTGTSITGTSILATNVIQSSVGYRCVNGLGGAISANVFNFFWTGSSMSMWVDATFIGSVQTVSDERYKQAIEPMAPGALDRIMALRPITYRFQDKGIFRDDGKPREGLLAQDVMRVIPSAVEGDPEGEDPLTLQPLPLIASLIKAVQELRGEVAALRARG